MTNDNPLFNWWEDDGFVNRPASRERAKREARDGTRSVRHKKISKRLELIGPYGATWKELGEMLGLHHGQISGALSNMHKNGEVFALAQQRDRCHPYVHIKFAEQYTEDERFDEPVKTVGSLRLEELEKWKGVAHLLAMALYNTTISNEDIALALDAYEGLTDGKP